jgi:hypothetical protein
VIGIWFTGKVKGANRTTELLESIFLFHADYNNSPSQVSRNLIYSRIFCEEQSPFTPVSYDVTAYCCISLGLLGS